MRMLQNIELLFIYVRLVDVSFRGNAITGSELILIKFLLQRESLLRIFLRQKSSFESPEQ